MGVCCCFALCLQAQKAQKIGYIDMDFILDQMPGYQQAQNQVLAMTAQWRAEISNNYKELQQLEQQLAADEPLLTPTLIASRKATIEEKTKYTTQLEAAYFGPSGKLFQMKQQLIRPIQDQIFNAVQLLVKRKKYDFIFDKSGSTTVLYANPKYDVSSLVMRYINKSLKQIELMEKKEAAKKILEKKLKKQRKKK